MMLLSIGATIRCLDGAAGKLKSVVLDPENGEVTHLIVEHGLLQRRKIVVPASWVERSSEREIVLNATLEDLNKLPDYDELDFLAPEKRKLGRVLTIQEAAAISGLYDSNV
jgi:hypothetical protein